MVSPELKCAAAVYQILSHRQSAWWSAGAWTWCILSGRTLSGCHKTQYWRPFRALARKLLNGWRGYFYPALKP